MRDSRKKTVVEIITGKTISFVIGYFVNMLVLPLFGVPVDAHGTFITVSLIFILISAFRSYVWRRLFNRFNPKWLQ